MATVADAWRPTSELERRLQETVRAGDQESYFRLLADSELVVPVPPDIAEGMLAGEAQPSWPTQEEDGRVHVLAYTSASAMRACLGPSYRHFVTVRFGDIAETWPDDRWWLAVDAPARGATAALPIESRLPAWFVRQVAAGDGRPPQVGRASPPWEELRGQHRGLPREPAAAPAAPAAEPGPVVEPAPEPAPEAASEPTLGQAPEPGPLPEQVPDPVAEQADAARGGTARAEFQPANDVERELLRAAANNDHDLFLQTLAATDVLLPIPDDIDYALRPGRPGFPWQTREVDGSTVVPVFTSPERLIEAAHAAGTGTEYIRLPFTVVLRYWPDHGWLLAINSGSPAGGTVLAQQLPGLAAWADQRAAQRMTADFEPQNDIEQRLFDAARRRDTDAFYSILLGAQVLVPADPDTPWGIDPADPGFPWRPVSVHGRTSIQIFTSLKWMNEAIGSSRFVMPTLVDVVAAWPETGWNLVLNPGTPIDATLPGDQVRALRGPDTPAASPAAAPAAATPPPPEAPAVPVAPPVPATAAPSSAPSPAVPAEPEAAVPSAPAEEPAGDAPDPTAPRTPGRHAAAVPAADPGETSQDVPEPSALPNVPEPHDERIEPRDAESPAPAVSEETAAARDDVRPPPPVPEPEPAFEPGNRIDQELYEAASGGDSDGFLRVLLNANVLVPIPDDAPLEVTPIQRDFRWDAALRTESAVQVFTSLVRLREVLPQSRFVYADFRELISGWPRDDWTMLLNPGTHIGASLRGDQVRELSQWAARVGLAITHPEVPPHPESAGRSEVPPHLDTPARPESPAHPETPARSDALVRPEAPGPSGVPSLSELPANPEVPTRADALARPEAAEHPGVSARSDLPAQPEVPARPELPARSEIPSHSEAPSGPEVSGGSEVPTRPEVTGRPEPLARPEALGSASGAQPDVSSPQPEVPTRPEVPGGPEVSGRSEVPTRPEIPGQSETLARPDASGSVAGAEPDVSSPQAEVPTRPEVPESPPEVQSRPEVPGRPEVGGRSEVPAQAADHGLPGVSSEPVVPDRPDVHDRSEALARPEVPAPALPEPEPEFVSEPGFASQRGHVPEPHPAADLDDRVASPTIMQKVVPHGHVAWYLEQGYDRVGGFVHSTNDVGELQTPVQLYEALGLLYEGSPFSPGDEGVYVIRWPAYCPDLYRIPFGGRNEEEMASWGEAGWVIERPPFLGTGFAPGSAGSIREYKVDSVRLPYGAEMYYLAGDRTERFVAMYDPDRLAWLRPDANAQSWNGRTEAAE
ncbi:SseB family protein [Actinomadura decatromicini]|uniref:SseB protein N-terminal domain-containing protein n=1 Tax=Actinomadura decatromicini TaxID=2604572 RepID=A0A5D3FXY2_9ACTN|nr:SseB family protein [Actinomadura decatromicini]TYK52570.1 hypothetical protein FXF68_02000 [Actinomadura decatromicini]